MYEGRPAAVGRSMSCLNLSCTDSDAGCKGRGDRCEEVVESVNGLTVVGEDERINVGIEERPRGC